MGILLFAAAAVLAVSAMYIRTSRIMDRLDRMLEDALNGDFREEHFTEDRLSRLEARMFRYLAAGRLDRERMGAERDAVKSLVSDISHQTKTPIANILLYTQLLGEQEGLDGQALDLTEQIESQAEKLNFLIQALVKLSRLENGIVTLVPEECGVGDLLQKVNAGEEARRKGIEFSMEPVPEGLCAWFDPKWTVEALANLVDNSIKYTPAGGKVRVEAREYEMFVRIDVADTGIGIPEEEQAKVFSRFYRSPGVSKEPGVGIGLYLAREIIQRQGGYIKVSSAPGMGSTFSVFLAKQPNLSEL